MHFKTAAGWAAVVVAALARVADGQSSGCAPYQRYVSALKNFDLPFVSKACSSLLHYSAATQTVTQTATDTKTITVATTTNFVAAQTRTVRQVPK
jgi:carbohydrate-binding DOMON domain-containing protein